MLCIVNGHILCCVVFCIFFLFKKIPLIVLSRACLIREKHVSSCKLKVEKKLLEKD